MFTGAFKMTNTISIARDARFTNLITEYWKLLRLVEMLKAQNDYLKGRLVSERSERK